MTTLKEVIIVCPTLRRAFYEWHRLAENCTEMWVDVCRKPMSLTSVTGTKYIFHSENEQRYLYGTNANIIAIDDFVGEKTNDNT